MNDELGKIIEVHRLNKNIVAIFILRNSPYGYALLRRLCR